MPEFGVVLEIDVFQRSAKMLALLHGLPDPVREMEVFQPMNIGGNRVSGHRIERDDQSDLQACLSEGLGHAERGACAKGMPDQYDRAYSPALAILQCFACKGGGEGVIGDSHADISTAKLFRKLIDPGRRDVCKPAQQIDLFAGMQRPERLGLA